MKKVFEIVLLFLLILSTYVLYEYRIQIHDRIYTFIYGLPCSQPLSYSIGTIDPRFKLTKSDAAAIVKKAAEAWNSTAHQQLLSQVDSNGSVIINFVYDIRQESTQQLTVLDIVLNEKNNQYQLLQSEFVSKQILYEKDKAPYDLSQTKLQQDLKDYNAIVNSYNEKGGAPADVYNQLATTKHQLDIRESELRNRANNLNLQLVELKKITSEINAIAKTHNVTASNYNAINVAAGSEFEEGQYMTDGKSKKIEIYQFSDWDKLLRVLEHELGHSLGLEHVTDPNAIMYKLNQSQSNVPTMSDLEELSRACTLNITVL